MNEKLISGYSAFASTDDVMNAQAGSPEVSPSAVVSVISIATSSFGAGFSVAWTVDAGC